MSGQNPLNLKEGSIAALPFYEQVKFIVGAQRGGGMGTVYQLLPLRPGASPLALKTYNSSKDYAQFEREARIWVTMSRHPAVAKAITYGQVQGIRCILAQWYPHHHADLNAAILDGTAVLQLVQHIIQGLEDGYAQHGLIHKDIKPTNILLDTANSPYLGDFGISSLVPDTASQQYLYPETWKIKPLMHEPNTVVSGTPRYMAPELFKGAKNSRQTDIFALGVTLFEWLTGQHPYLSAAGRFKPDGLIGFPEYLRHRYGEAIDPLSKLVVQALNLDRTERPATYQALLQKSDFLLDNPPPSDATPHFFARIDQAQVLQRQGHGDEALHILRRELADRPHDVLLLTAYANTLLRLDQTAEASIYLQKAVVENRALKNRYMGKPYFEPNLNAALIAMQERRFTDAADLISEVQAWLLPAEARLTDQFWEFVWLEIYYGRRNTAYQRIQRYLSTHGAIEPVLALLCLTTANLPNRTEALKQSFDLIAGTPCRDIGSAQYYCVIASALDVERRHRFQTKVVPLHLQDELAKLSAEAYGDANYFKVPMTATAIRDVLNAIAVKYCGGTCHGGY